MADFGAGKRKIQDESGTSCSVPENKETEKGWGNANLKDLPMTKGETIWAKKINKNNDHIWL